MKQFNTLFTTQAVLGFMHKLLLMAGTLKKTYDKNDY